MLEPAYSNLIDHLDMKHVKASTRFIADCIRYAKGKGVEDAKLEAIFMECVAEVSNRPLQDPEAQTVAEQFRKQIDDLTRSG
jgi:hypothetical protein